MTIDMKFKVGPTLKAPVAGIVPIEPTLLTDCAKCEGNVHLGVFFDGTNNNMEAHSKELGDTNIARLFNAYLDKHEKGYYCSYIPGVGTPFPEIREEGDSKLGNGFAIGSEERVLFGLTWVLNAIHASAFNEAAYFTDAQVTALCCSQSIHSSIIRTDDHAALASLGLENGLRIPDAIGDGMRETILKDHIKKLEKKLLKGRPVIKECFIDIFGFSRGAAQARVFCHWLDDLLVDGKLAGIIVHFRFVGLFDSVASAGFWSSVALGTIGVNGGHSGWADSRYLRIPASVKNCVHMVAMHELRKNFPLDTITIDGALPPHCQEFTYPGAHSDLGGGYTPGALGVSVGKDAYEGDALKLAQIPLNHMFDCAVAAGVPLIKDEAKTKYNSKPFAINPRVQKAFVDFLNYSTLKPRALHDWLQPYLNWRWEVRARYATLNHVSKASKSDAAMLMQFNGYFLADAQLLDITGRRSLWSRFSPLSNALHIVQSARLATLDNEAPAVLAAAKAAAPTGPASHHMFDYFVHDSMAGFNHRGLEPTGYWRYRKGFLGSPKRLIAENDSGSDMDRVSATG
ncbi:MAG: DUF2235 domain-containing protein [Pseudomonadota bacterium]|nr:DUF2235 domain-containing protein [Pseudomonadota bacterium]